MEEAHGGQAEEGSVRSGCSCDMGQECAKCAPGASDEYVRMMTAEASQDDGAARTEL